MEIQPALPPRPSAMDDAEVQAWLETVVMTYYRQLYRYALSLSAVRRPTNSQLDSAARMSRRRWLGWGAGSAASLAVGGKWWWDTRAFTVSKLTREVTAITRRGISLSLMSMDKTAVEDWLVSNHAPRIDGLPEKLDALGRKGCHLSSGGWGKHG